MPSQENAPPVATNMHGHGGGRERRGGGFELDADPRISNYVTIKPLG